MKLQHWAGLKLEVDKAFETKKEMNVFLSIRV